MSVRILAVVVFLAWSWPAAAGAQDLAASARRFWCDAPRANSADDPVIQPARIFDNVYAIGSVGTVAYVVRTSGGLMLIDALPANELESRLLPGFAALGLDPAQVKTVLVAHGHGDHFGGAAHFQQRYGARVYLGAADWAATEGQRSAPARDGELQDGSTVTLGDVTVRAVAIPGHTPGSMGFIFPVIDRGQRHVAALFGGAWLTTRLNDEGMKTYLASVARFREATTAAGVDAWLQNHPLMVPFQDWVTRAASRASSTPNPFVVGRAGYQAFVDAMETCTRRELERRQKQP